MIPLCSVYLAPSYEANLTLLAPFPTELIYLSMLFISAVQTISRINSMLKKATSDRNHASNGLVR